MRLIGKFIVIIILIGILLSASAYIILYTDENGGPDTKPPQITSISGNFTVTAGQTATIIAVFTDNVNVTKATLYYTIERISNLELPDYSEWKCKHQHSIKYHN